jgi:hypothetical protein
MSTKNNFTDDCEIVISYFSYVNKPLFFSKKCTIHSTVQTTSNAQHFRDKILALQVAIVRSASQAFVVTKARRSIIHQIKLNQTKSNQIKSNQIKGAVWCKHV